MRNCDVFLPLFSVCKELKGWEKMPKISNLFTIWRIGLSPNHFKIVHVNEIRFTQYLLTINFLRSGVDIADGNIIGGLAEWSSQKIEKTVRRRGNNNHIIYKNNNNAVFQSYYCTDSDEFLNGTFSCGRKVTKCNERVEIVYPRIVDQIRESLFQKPAILLLLSTYVNEHSSQNQQSFCQIRDLHNYKNNGVIWETSPISIIVSSIVVKEAILLCISDSLRLFGTFVGALKL